MIELLGRIVGDGPLREDLQSRALEMFATLLQQPGTSELKTTKMVSLTLAGGLGPANITSATASAGNRRLIYVHGICEHETGFSDPWWVALSPFVSAVFGQGALGQNRLEVIWSDLVNQAATAMNAALTTASAAPVAGLAADATEAEQDRRRAAEEIKEALRDRADQQMLSAAVRADGLVASNMAAADTSTLISIPGLNCIDDFSIYLIHDGTRQQIIDRFIDVVRPELEVARELDIIGHSWGTVVAYEGLRQLEDEGLTAPLVRNFFTVGAALSIGPVKRRLRAANRDGRKPASVRRWINLDAHGDIVGGPLKGRPYEVDFDFVSLEPVGCNGFLGLVNPSCAHSSYFDADNVAVNQSIFARFIDQP
jgi:hypothetical protein